MPADFLGLRKAHVVPLSCQLPQMRRCGSGRYSHHWKKRKLVSVVIFPLHFSGQFGSLFANAYLSSEVGWQCWVNQLHFPREPQVVLLLFQAGGSAGLLCLLVKVSKTALMGITFSATFWPCSVYVLLCNEASQASLFQG
jgi:hypothetical protein